MRNWLGVATGVALSLAGCATTLPKIDVAEQSGIPTGFINKSLMTEDKRRPYVVYVPRDYDPRKPWPLILFLHGAGERGDDGLRQTEVGIGHAIRLSPKGFPCLVVMPQCPEKVWWDAVASDIETALTQTLGEYNVDPQRIYLTGLSMGGFATWMLGAQKPEVFAALMPICGGGNPEDAPALASTPIWAFHGADDLTVPPEKSREMVDAVREAGGSVKYTEFPETGHNSWDKAYGDPKAISWLLKQKKPQ